MTITIYEFEDMQGDEPIYPPKTRRAPLNLDEFHAVSDMVVGVLVYTTSAVHLRISRDNMPGNEADQNDVLLGADATAYFVVRRKERGTHSPIYIYATADT